MSTEPSKSLQVMKVQPLGRVASVKELLYNDQARDQLASVAAKHLNPERMMRLIANAMRTTPKLAECEPMSLLGALMTTASLGLEPNTVLGHAYLVPFFNGRKKVTEVQLVVGYKGYIDLARRSGQIISMHADVVYSDDDLWSYEYGSQMHLRHKPGPKQGQPTHAYCHVTLPDGQAFVVLPWAEIMATRDASQGWQSAVKFNATSKSPWTTHTDRMAAKTAVRRIANSGEIPLSIEFQRAMEVDTAPADFASFATGAGDGPIIEGDGEAIIPEGGEIDPDTGEVKPEPEQKPQPQQQDRAATTQQTAAPRPQQAAPKPEPQQQQKKPPQGPDKMDEDFVAQFEGDIATAANQGDVESIADMYRDQIAQIAARWPDGAQRMKDAIDLARERTSGAV